MGSGTRLSDDLVREACDMWLACKGSRSTASRKLGIGENSFQNRIEQGVLRGFLPSTNYNTILTAQAAIQRPISLQPIEDRSISIPDPDSVDEDFIQVKAPQKRGRLMLEIDNGTILIAGDCHYWPDNITPAHRALVKFCRDLKPSVIVMNGDVFDGAGISRHGPIMWETSPGVVDEIETCKLRLQEIRMAAPKAQRIWTFGNHDARFESRLAMVAPEYARVHGVHLKDNFPDWQACWSTWINDDVVIKHRFSGGAHAAYNNAIKSGKNIFTNHLHRPNVRGFSDYNGRRYGVDTGCIADPYGPQFTYTEDNPLDWCAGFAVATIHKGKLLMPELCEVLNEKHVQFRGQVIEV